MDSALESAPQGVEGSDGAERGLRAVRAALAGVAGATVATALGGIFYAFTTARTVTAQDVAIVVIVALSGWARIWLGGAVAGVLSPVLLRRLGTAGGILAAAALAALLGGLIGFTYRATHVSWQHAVGQPHRRLGPHRARRVLDLHLPWKSVHPP